MKAMRNWLVVMVLTTAVVGLSVLGMAAARAQGIEGAVPGAVETVAAGTGHVAASATGAAFYSIAITVGLACLSAGYAVGKVGAAALGAASEKPEIMGRALIFVGLAEGIAIYGLIVAIMLIRTL